MADTLNGQRANAARMAVSSCGCAWPAATKPPPHRPRRRSRLRRQQAIRAHCVASLLGGRLALERDHLHSLDLDGHILRLGLGGHRRCVFRKLFERLCIGGAICVGLLGDRLFACFGRLGVLFLSNPALFLHSRRFLHLPPTTPLSPHTTLPPSPQASLFPPLPTTPSPPPSSPTSSLSTSSPLASSPSPSSLIASTAASSSAGASSATAASVSSAAGS